MYVKILMFNIIHPLNLNFWLENKTVIWEYNYEKIRDNVQGIWKIFSEMTNTKEKYSYIKGKINY